MKASGKYAAAVICALAIAATGLPLSGQQIKVNPKFGSVSADEVKMSEYPADTAASILLLYGRKEISVELDPMGGFVKVIRYHDRWKVLKESGKDETDYELFYSTDNSNVEHIGGIKATTYNLEEGKVKEQKMSKKFIFDEKYADGVNRVTFAPENVKVGSVVEVVYELRSPRVHIGRLYFQQDYPVNKMEVNVSYAEYLHYSRIQLGREPVRHETDNSVRTVNYGDGNIYNYNLITDSYTVSDVPALRQDAYSYCPRHYRTGVNYEIHSFNVPGVTHRDFNTTWDNVDRMVTDSDLLRCCKARFKDAEELKAEMDALGTEREKIAAARQYVISRVKWNKQSNLIPRMGRSLLKDGSGDNADINALVASALNTLGYKAEPVLVKLRTSGPMTTYQISADQFDTFILRITCPNGEVHFLDAVRDAGYPDILAPNTLVSQARVMTLDGIGSWIDLSAVARKNIRNEVAQFSVSEDGSIGGTVNIKGTGEESYAIRSSYYSFSSTEEWIENAEKDASVDIISMALADAEDYKPEARVSIGFETGERLGADLIYLDVFVDKFHSETAFSNEQRKLPVDFPYPRSISYKCIVQIPDGYAVESIPQNTQYVCQFADGGQMKTTLLGSSTGNVISLNFRFDSNVYSVSEAEYVSLRTFWEQLCKLEKSIIVLKKL